MKPVDRGLSGLCWHLVSVSKKSRAILHCWPLLDLVSTNRNRTRQFYCSHQQCWLLLCGKGNIQSFKLKMRRSQIIWFLLLDVMALFSCLSFPIPLTEKNNYGIWWGFVFFVFCFLTKCSNLLNYKLSFNLTLSKQQKWKIYNNKVFLILFAYFNNGWNVSKELSSRIIN